MIRSRRCSRGWTVCVSALLATGCGGGSHQDQSQPGVAGGRIQGNVSSSRDSALQTGASVRSGALGTATDANGLFVLAPIASGERVIVTASQAGFADTLKVVAVGDSAGAFAALRITPVGASQTFDPAATGAVLTIDNRAQLAIPPNAFQRTDVGAPNAPVTAQMTPLDPTATPNPLPGDSTTLITDPGFTGDPLAWIETFGGQTISAVDAQASPLQLAPNTALTLRIPARSQNTTLPNPVRLYYLDQSTGRWVFEGTAALSADRLYYEGQVARMAHWTTGLVITTIDVTGCVLTADGRAAPPGVTVTADGTDYSAATYATTDSQGCYTIKIKSGGRATLSAANNPQSSAGVAVGPSDKPITAPSNLTLAAADTVNVTLSWGVQPGDVDAHLIAPDGSHIYFKEQGTLTRAPYISLDVDAIGGSGREALKIDRLMIGTYSYLVNNRSATFEPGLTDSPARVEVSAGGSSASYTPPANEGANLWWHVFDLEVGADCRPVIRARQSWVAGLPGRDGPANFCSSQ